MIPRRYPLLENYSASELEDLTGKEAILSYLTNTGMHPEVRKIGDMEVLIFGDFIVDDFEFPSVKEKCVWLYGSNAGRLVQKVTDELEKRFNKLFWGHPQPLYHATNKKEIAELIQKEGLKCQNITRTIGNNSVGEAVFTSTELDVIMDSYGPYVFYVDTMNMKQSGFMPEVAKEPNHVESDVLNVLAHNIEAWEEQKDLTDSSSGTSDYTIILYQDIPAKYLTLLE